MASLPVYGRDGSQVGTIELSPEDLAPQVNQQLLHDAVVMYQANLRQGTHRTKTRGEVSGSTKKMYRQKGTGNARAGHRRSGVRRGGGHIHAKRPRDYSYRLPRKALQLATRMAWAAKLAGGGVVVVDELKMEQPKTREIAALLKALPLAGETTLLAVESHDPMVYKSARNIEGVTVAPVADTNALLVLRPGRVLVTRAAVEQLKQSAAKARERRPAAG